MEEQISLNENGRALVDESMLSREATSLGPPVGSEGCAVTQGKKQVLGETLMSK